jgi:molecular chaperone DnaK
MGKAIGIDLGTTNTAVAVLVDGRPRVLEDEKGYKVLPSCVAFKGDGSRIVGQAARNLIITQPENTAYAVKRLMGRRFDSPEVAEVQKLVSYKIAASEDGMCKIRVGEDWYTPLQISAFILEVARVMAERTLGEPVDEAVITVPAYFNHAQRSATLEAARMAGLRCERLLNEPTAAALAYGYRKDVERRIVVYDLGGGTFDVSVLQLARGIYEVLATNGETHLGGEDFDQRIVDQLSEDFQAKTGVDPRTDPTGLQRLKDAAERAKCELSFTDRTTILIPMITMADNLETALSRLTLEGLVDDLIERTLEITKDAIKAAGLRLADVDDVILVGGQTRMPRVREAIRSLFQKEPSRSVHPEEVVAIGAAVHATSLTSQDIKQTVLLDVTPFDLGIDVAGGLFKKIIEANSQVPASFTETFATVRDHQRHVRVTVRQGGSPAAEENEFLGEFVMTGLSPAPRMETKVEVTFKIDTNGMLHASAMEQGSGERKRITIRNYAEYVQGDGSITPDLEGDLDIPNLDEIPPYVPEDPSSVNGVVARPAPRRKKGLFQRIFGRRDQAKGTAKPTPSPVVAAETEGAEAVGDAEATAPQMPAFLQELSEDDVAVMEPVDELDMSTGLDAVGGGLDALGLDALGLGELTPLSSADLVPVGRPSSTAEPLTEDDSEELFVMPDSDEEIYEDEELFEDDADEAVLGDEAEPTEQYGAEEEVEFLEDDGLLVDEEDAFLEEEVVLFEDEDALPEEEDLTEEADRRSVVDAEEDATDTVDTSSTSAVDLSAPEWEEFVPIPDDPPDGPEAAEQMAAHEDQTEENTLDGLLVHEDFEVDDSTRSLVEALNSPEAIPLPVSDVREELLWDDDDLPDDGTVEFTRDGATSTPRAASWTSSMLGNDPPLGDAETLVPTSKAMNGIGASNGLTIDGEPDDFEEAPTDPPLEIDTSGDRPRMRITYSDDLRLAEDLTKGLRRGGCFVSSETPLDEGIECVIEYSSPGLDGTIEIAAVVTWSTAAGGVSANGHPPGMDVEFDTERAQRTVLSERIEALRG